MSAITIEMIITLIKKYWWLVVVVAVVIYILVLRTDCALKASKIASQATELKIKDKTIADLQDSIGRQNKAVDQMVAKGKEQVVKLDGAIEKVNNMKPVTKETVREIYIDKSKDAQQLLLNAITD